MQILEHYEAFKGSHAISRLRVSGNDWSYIDTGHGAHAVVLLPGAGGFEPDCMFPVVSALENTHRVIAVAYPPSARGAPEALQGILAILDHCEVGLCSVVGHSLGGFLARVLVRAYPRRIDSLIIANSADYTPGRRLLVRSVLPLLILLPNSFFVSALRSKFERLLAPLPDSEREFWTSYLEHSAAMNPRGDSLRNQCRLMLDLLRFLKDRPIADAPWQGRVLIIESSNETGFTLRERLLTRAIYPAATVHIIEDGGHGSFLTHPGEFNAAVGVFLGGQAG